MTIVIYSYWKCVSVTQYCVKLVLYAWGDVHTFLHRENQRMYDVGALQEMAAG